MEQDLRDAYAALKLLRADLVKTRRDKQVLEASLTHVQTHGLPPSAAHIRESRETQLMQQEDANSQLWRLAIKFNNKLLKMEKMKMDNNCQKKDNLHDIGDKQHKNEDQMETQTLFKKLQSLTITVEEQTETISTQQAAFLLQKEELKTMLKEMQQMLHKEKNKVLDAVLEQQQIKEKYELLETQVDMLKEEKSHLEKEMKEMEIQLETQARTSSTLTQQLKEKEEDILKWKREEMLQFDEKRNELMEEVNVRLRREKEVREKELYDTYEQKMLELQGENELLKMELNCEKEKKFRDKDKIRERHERALSELERNCAEMKAHIADMESERTADVKKYEEALKEAEEQHATTVKSLEMKLVEVQKQLAASKANRLTERQEYQENLAEALKKLQDQREDRDQHVSTIRRLQSDLEVAQTQLEMSKAELAKEVKNNQERLNGMLQQLRDQQHNEERNAMIVRDLESKLSEGQLQFGDKETNLLARLNEYEKKLMKTSQIAAQHEDTTRMLALKNKTLQQEIREARHTLKLMSEELHTFQSVCEEKTQEHMRCMNQIQVQCESLETQLLSAEDQREPSYATKSVHDSSTLDAFHGRTDDEITGMSSWRSWDLLRSGIKEINGFLPQLQTLLGAMNDALILCDTHADALPVLCERLEREAASEKEQLPILTTALRLLRFAGMLKARTQEEEEVSVTADFVQSFRKRVLNALAQWYECDAGDNDQGEIKPMPTPTFTTTSRETALILQNWTDDRTKQLGVRRWLARMEAYPGVPPLRGASSNRVLELPPEGCTLELDDMTSEVKDAFLLLVIPILKQNRALHVRVFIRYVCNKEAMLKQQEGDEEVGIEKVWSMRIHAQSTVTRPRPSSLKLSPSSRGSPSPLAPTSPASSVSSLSSTASSRLQIIQERLQYLHHNV
ncbi:unnamed protein product [Peronospora farinosa]|uniref:Uncharacterized protein n=1 Tax=Peronospora farinosa TaxID=134698 RepID=A0AAV0TD31_9STRA|nr:unnamed protein product [Peronospora farinosa]